MSKKGAIISNMVPEFNGFPKDAPKKEPVDQEVYSINNSFSKASAKTKEPISVQFLISIVLFVGMLIATVGIWAYSSFVLSKNIDAEFSRIVTNSEVLDIPQIKRLISFHGQLQGVRTIFDLRPNLLGVLSSVEHSLYSGSYLEDMSVSFNDNEYTIVLRGVAPSLVKYIDVARSLQDNELFRGGEIKFTGGTSGALQADSDDRVKFTYNKRVRVGELETFLVGIQSGVDVVQPSSKQEEFLQDSTNLDSVEEEDVVEEVTEEVITEQVPEALEQELELEAEGEEVGQPDPVDEVDPAVGEEPIPVSEEGSSINTQI